MGGCLSTNRGQGSRSSSGSSQQENLPLSERPNKPLKRPKEWTHDPEKDGPVPSITSLQKEREDFWYTRVTGRAEVWAAIRKVCEMLMANDSDEQLKTARQILISSEITMPTGTFDDRGAYDGAGNNYLVPRHIISNPINVREASPPRESIDSWQSSETGKSSMSEELATGKITCVSYMVRFRVHNNGAGKDYTIRVWGDEKLRRPVKRLLKQLDLAPEDYKAYVLVDGRLFDLKKTLMDPSQPTWLANRVIQVMLRPTALPEPSPPDASDNRLQVFPPPPPQPGTLSVPLESGTTRHSEENAPGPSRRGLSADSESSKDSQTPTLVSDPKTI
ncbi:hypothetical protein TWF718_010666 [Orbilia javanica]|uniref:DC-UbP/UBTD2 N-terminal domain-containing protein n=1 Tax=Orbilia javanica TaxID=47235 RepID=A0AAN8REP5_9PEZI